MQSLYIRIGTLILSISLIIVVFFGDALSGDDKKEIHLPVDRVAHLYHGTLLDEKRRELKLKPAEIIFMQDSLIEYLLKYESASLNSMAARWLKGMKELMPSEGEEMILKHAVLNMILKKGKSRERLEYKVKYDILLPAIWLWQRPLELRIFVLDWAEEFELYSWIDQIAESSGDYIKDCRAAGVPIPPDWPDERWKYQGTLTFTFIEQGREETKVYAYLDPELKGACIALPRINDGKIEPLGFICQGYESGRACFWDNISRKSGTKLRGPEDELSFKIADIQGGDVLADNCTECHRGENAFMIHPQTPLQLPAPYETRTYRRYDPLGQADWSNPPYHDFPDGDAAACEACHKVPQLHLRFCALLVSAADYSMPSQSDPVGWDNPQGYAAASMNHLKEACGD